MLFPTHLVAAGLLSRVTRLSPWWLVVGAALPDVVDKPLGLLGVVDLYHSVGHAALLVVLMVPIALSGRAGLATAVGWVSHLLLDALHVVVNGRPGDALFLGWPLTVPPDPLAIPPGSFIWYYLGTPSFYLDVLLWVALAVVVVAERRDSSDAVADQ
ncbi:hypothetical protein Harman_11270 [Haloarcula mannanilytica]|uniref:LexA-binding, inner membrane-associated hydrolase n=1 Tax=Haloarcula mannanilytica TaxID=2509225 RepID=A0A4C2EFQ5_9EURY|nr:metal-dependent hydrolase [Haloarcula mannanilytica]GCF13192.1 hypothetical protein Harman_11270 [Haloarcula mannanilytica]